MSGLPDASTCGLPTCGGRARFPPAAGPREGRVALPRTRIRFLLGGWGVLTPDLGAWAPSSCRHSACLLRAPTPGCAGGVRVSASRRTFPPSPPPCSGLGLVPGRGLRSGCQLRPAPLASSRHFWGVAYPARLSLAPPLLLSSPALVTPPAAATPPTPVFRPLPPFSPAASPAAARPPWVSGWRSRPCSPRLGSIGVALLSRRQADWGCGL